MSMRATVSEKGQVTIPKALRDRLGIRPGAVLEFRDDGGSLIATKAAGADPVDVVYGILPPTRTDDLLQRTRGTPDAL